MSGGERQDVLAAVPGSWTAAVDYERMDAYFAALDTISGRYEALGALDPADYSYTQKLLADQNARVQKVGCEAAELVREDADPAGSPDRLVGEAADLVYGVEVMVVARGGDYRAVLFEQARRFARWRDGPGRPATLPASSANRAAATDARTRAAALGSDVMWLVSLECAPTPERYCSGAFVETAADVVDGAARMVAARGAAFTDVLDELVARNRPAQAAQP